MIQSYGNSEAQKLFEDGKCKKLPNRLKKRALLLLDIMDNVETLKDLRLKAFPPDIRLHKLKGSISHRHAIDINKVDGWRITFEFKNGSFTKVAIENYHK